MNSVLTDFGAILLTAIFSHLLLLLNSGRYWDSWFLSAWQITGDDASMKRFYDEVGMPAWYYIHRAMGRLPHFIYWYNSLTFLALLINPILVFEICRYSGFLTHGESLMIACLSAGLPLPQMVVDYIVGMHYVCPLTLFYTAWLLVLPTLPMHHVVALQALACLLFLLSFNMNSLLVFYAWFYFLNFLIEYRLQGIFSLSYLVIYVLQTWYLLVLPPLFWFFKQKWTPTSGPYATYNQLTLPPVGQLIGKFGKLYLTAFYRVAEAAMGYALENVPFLLLLFPATAWILYGRALNRQPFLSTPFHHSLLLIALSIIGVALAGIPYLLVGQTFGSKGWVTKNSTLLTVPVACGLTGLLCILIKPIWIFPSVAVLLGVFIAYWNYSYLCWYAICAKYEAILYHFGKVPDVHQYSVIGLCDLHYISAGSYEHPEHGHGCATVSYMFSFLTAQVPRFLCFPDLQEALLQADGGLYSRITIDKLIEESTLSYGFTEVNRAGAQAMVFIFSKGRRRRWETVSCRYLQYRIFRRGKLEKFYDSLLTLEFIPLPRKPIQSTGVRQT